MTNQGKYNIRKPAIIKIDVSLLLIAAVLLCLCAYISKYIPIKRTYLKEQHGDKDEFQSDKCNELKKMNQLINYCSIQTEKYPEKHKFCIRNNRNNVKECSLNL